MRTALPIAMAVAAALRDAGACSACAGAQTTGRDEGDGGKLEDRVFQVCTLNADVVPDCNCDFASADRVNERHVRPLLANITKLPFFGYFRVRLHCDCPLWDDDGTCANRNCGVDECPAAEVPMQCRSQPNRALYPHDDASQWNDADVDTRWGGDATNARQTGDGAAPFTGWHDVDNPWTWDDEAEPDDAAAGWAYVDLRRNPERYTGYGGEHAHRIWKAVYSQPCFAHLREEDDTDGSNLSCDAHASKGRRVLYRLISGMHASITAHISQEYPMDVQRSDDCVWGPNLAHFHASLGQDTVAHANRLSNLYFTYLFVLRAMTKACAFLRAADYTTGNAEADALAIEYMASLCDEPKIEALTCSRPFDEASVFLAGAATGGADARRLLEAELMEHFQSISAVMNCVGCEKCRLWGKLQILGLATALKILFHDVDATAHGTDVAFPQLARNEVVALVNLMSKLAASVHTVRSMRQQLAMDFVNNDGFFAAGSSSSSGGGGGFFEEEPKVPWY